MENFYQQMQWDKEVIVIIGSDEMGKESLAMDLATKLNASVIDADLSKNKINQDNTEYV